MSSKTNRMMNDSDRVLLLGTRISRSKQPCSVTAQLIVSRVLLGLGQSILRQSGPQCKT
jgi:hypothetical protein